MVDMLLEKNCNILLSLNIIEFFCGFVSSHRLFEETIISILSAVLIEL